MLKNRMFYSVSLAIALFCLSACGSSSDLSDNDSGGVSYSVPSDVLTDIDVSSHGYTDQAIIALNLYPLSSGSYESAGTVPSSIQRSPLPSRVHQHRSFSESMHPHQQFMSAMKDGQHMQFSSSNFERYQSVTDSTVTTNFYVFDLSDDLIIEEATRIYNGDHCYIFISTSLLSSVNQSLADDVGEFFDDSIYDAAINDFDTTPLDVDGNNKIILFYSSISSAGYFYALDFYEFDGSNRADMLYVHKDYILDGSADALLTENARVIAHEFHHLLNRSERARNNNLDGYETWIEEGIAEGGTKYTLDIVLDQHFDALSTDSAISNGLGIVYWTGYLNDYSLTHTFMEYARVQSDMGVSFYKALMENYVIADDYRAVFDVVDTNAVSGNVSKFDNFASLLRDYHIANLVNASTGLYSYSNDSGLNEYQAFISQMPNPSSISPSISPGGGLYFIFDDTDDAEFLNFNPDGYGDNIFFYRINKAE